MIRLLREDDLAPYVELRREALRAAPLAFASSPGEDFASNPDVLRSHLSGSPDEVIYGAFAESLVGSIGLYRDRHEKAAHKAHIWGMYVKPTRRGQGLGSKLLDAALAHARSLPNVLLVHLGVTAAAPAAQGIYERAGFRAWGTEPQALCHGDECVDETHMVLSILRADLSSSGVGNEK